jgi:hypothetical protein
MGDELKSAYELAIEKLNRKDKESPPDSTAPKKLTALQKGKIAEIRREIEAKLAEREILFKSEKRAARGDFDQIAKIEDAYRRDREHLLSRQAERIKEVKEGKTAG